MHIMYTAQNCRKSGCLQFESIVLPERSMCRGQCGGNAVMQIRNCFFSATTSTRETDVWTSDVLWPSWTSVGATSGCDRNSIPSFVRIRSASTAVSLDLRSCGPSVRIFDGTRLRLRSGRPDSARPLFGLVHY